MSDLHTSRRSAKRKKTKKRNASSWSWIWKTLVVIFLICVIGGVSYAAKLLADVNNAANDAYTPRKRETTVNGKKVELDDDIDPLKDPISVLLMGIDDDEERALGSARTDTMILLTINPKDDKISMVSIPRDTYTYIDTPKYKGMDKINAAYTYGGDEGAIQAVQDLLNLPINYYLTVDFISFEKVINALGGIEINVPFDIHQEYASENYTDGPVIIHKGKQTLNGADALVYARMRKVDTDIERGKRGQEVIEQTIKKATEVGSITKYTDVIKAIDGHFWTDMPMSTMKSIAQSGLTKQYKFDSYAFSWMSFDYEIHGGISNMVGLHKDSLDYISHRLRLSLGLDKPDERDVDGYEFKSDEIVSEKTYPKDLMSSDSYQYDNSGSSQTNYYNNNQGQMDNYNGYGSYEQENNGETNGY